MVLIAGPILAASLTLIAGGCQRNDPPLGVSAQQDGAPSETSLAPIADTYLRQGSPNQNQGTASILRLQSSGKNRALLRWDPQAITQAVGSGSLSAARLEVTILSNADNWSTAGRTIDLHRLTQSWTETGATWNCAADANPANSSADCSGATAWAMDGPGARPWAPTPTATQTISNGQRGMVSFDVTADVAAMLAGGGAQNGWILKKTDEGASGHVEFGSRESATPPRLVLTIAPLGPPGANWPVLTNTLPDLDTTRVIQLQGDSFEIFRTDFSLRFKTEISDSAKVAFFTRHSLTVVGVDPSGRFFVRMPDPGLALQSFYDALDRFRSEPEIFLVTLVPRTPLPSRDPLRLPADGPGQARSDWLSNSSTTWAMRAIRAPLAWGCETGDYGGGPVAVGVLEWKHQWAHPEFARSVPQLREPTDAQLGAYKSVHQDTAAAKEAHAVATTGLLTSDGDNASGIAGVTWRTRLFLYAGYSAGNRPLDLVTGLYVPTGWMVSDNIKVLSLSIDGGIPDTIAPIYREALIRDAAVTLQQTLLDDLPSLLVVVAAGNSSYRGTVNDYLRDTSATLLLGALLILREDPRYRDRIVIAAGSEMGNRFWTPGSNFFIGGATDIAAPSEDVRVLARWTGQTGSAVPLTTQHGTSLAAPLVAGVAAQLLAMDSTLTSAQVKDYILRGAQEPRLSPGNGQLEPPSLVAGAPETVYQLDAYGAVTLLSRERPGTPICGYPVSIDSDNQSIVLERAPGNAISLPVAGSEFLQGVSVAQGGRRIAVLNGTSEGRLFSIEIDQQANVLGQTPDGVERRFLERDTADLEYDPTGVRPYPLLTLRRGDGTPPVQQDIFAPARTFGWNLAFGVSEIAPSGDLAAVILTEVDTTVSGCGVANRWHLVPLGGGAPTRWGEHFWDCFLLDEGATIASWSHDGRRVLFIGQRARQSPFQPLESTITDAVPGGASRDIVFPDRFIGATRFSSDDSVLVAGELDQDFICTRVLRPAASPQNVLTVLPGQLLVDCVQPGYKVVPNAPPNRGAPVAGASWWFSIGQDLGREPHRGSLFTAIRTPRTHRSLVIRPMRVQAN